MADDGEFFVPIDIFKEYVGYSQVNFNMDNVSRAYHLTIGDEKNNGTGKVYCFDCTYHKFEIVSEIDQKVNLRASTWDGRGYPAACQG